MKITSLSQTLHPTQKVLFLVVALVCIFYGRGRNNHTQDRTILQECQHTWLLAVLHAWCRESPPRTNRFIDNSTSSTSSSAAQEVRLARLKRFSEAGETKNKQAMQDALNADSNRKSENRAPRPCASGVRAEGR